MRYRNESGKMNECLWCDFPGGGGGGGEEQMREGDEYGCKKKGVELDVKVLRYVDTV